MDTLLRYAVASLFFLFGIGCLVGGFTSEEFFSKPLGSQKIGPQMPKWLGRPLFILIGAGAMYGAIQVFRGH